MLEDILKSRVGIVIISVIWGLGLSTLFRKACLGRTCTVIKYTGPDPHSMNDTYFNYGTQACYKYKPFVAQCERRV